MTDFPLEAMSRREFLAAFSLTCLAGAGLSSIFPVQNIFASSSITVIEPSKDSSTAALVDRVMASNLKAMREDSMCPVIARTVSFDHIEKADDIIKTIRQFARDYMLAFPHSPWSPFLRAKKEAALSTLQVLLKINGTGYDAPQEIDYKCTHPAFIEGIVDALEDLGITAGNIIIAEGARYDQVNTMVHALDVGGYLELIGRRGLTFLDMNAYKKAFAPPFARLLEKAGLTEERYFTSLEWIVMEPSKELAAGAPPGAFSLCGPFPGAPLLPRRYVEMLDKGWVINLPKLKVHRLAIASGALKNLMGVLGYRGPDGTKPPHLQKDMIHDGFKAVQSPREFVLILKTAAARLSDLYLAARPHLSVYDGMLTAGGNGLSNVYPVKAPQIFGSENSIFADVAELSALGYLDNSQLRKLLNFEVSPLASLPLARFYPGFDVHDVDFMREGKKVASLALTGEPYYCELAFADPGKDYTTIGMLPRDAGGRNPDKTSLKTPFHRLLPAVVKTDSSKVRSKPFPDSPELFLLKGGQQVFVRGTDKINVKFSVDGVTGASPRTGQSLKQDNMWFFVDCRGDGTLTGWVAGGDLDMFNQKSHPFPK